MQKRILVIEDEEKTREITRMLLEKRGFAVECAENGLVALEKIKEQLPDVIILDVIMPIMDGYTFYKELKKDFCAKEIPVLVLTARHAMSDAFEVMGVDGFVSKPIAPDELVEEINDIFELSTFRREVSDDESGGRKKILLVGNDHVILSQMCNEIKRMGLESFMVTTGSEAIAKAVKLHANFIFIDVQMEDMSSSEIVDILRRLPQYAQSPIIGFSYYDTNLLNNPNVRQKVLRIHEASKQLLKCGATQYMGRFHPHILSATIMQFIKGS